jgi:ligand-binding sensor domain-containing protein
LSAGTFVIILPAMPLRRCFFCLFFVSILLPASAQKAANAFRHLTPDDGLSNESVRGIAQDQYGFIWLGTQFGLNRFDGIHIKSWFHDPADSTTIPNNFVRSMYSDVRGRVWIGGDPGFCQYDYPSNSFIRYRNSDFNMVDIDGDKYGNTWIATNRGLKKVDTVHHGLIDIRYDKDSSLSKILNGAIRDVHCGRDGRIYMATGAGILIYDPATDQATRIHKGLPGHLLPADEITAVVLDHDNRIWAGIYYNNAVLVRLDADLTRAVTYDEFRNEGKKFTPSTIGKLFVDRKGRVWSGSSFWGLAKYDPSTDHFIRYTHDPALPNSISCNQALSFLHDRSGLLWTGSEGYGVNYFNPDHDIFSPVQQNPHLSRTLPDNWCRAFAEDAEDHLWVATAKGLAVLDARNQGMKTIDNSDSSHGVSVRALLTDRDGNIWIGTAEGLNRYHPATGKIDSYGDADNMPRRFTWFVQQLRNGKVLVGNNAGLFEYLPGTNKFYHYKDHPALGNYNLSLRAFAEASNGDWWLGTFAAGVVVYDPVEEKVVRVIARDSTKAGLSSNFLQDIKEDKDGNMWLSTRYKLNCYNPATHTNTTYSIEEGLPSNWIGGILFDSLNRVWVSTGKGLCVLNSERKVVKVFGLKDGLFSTQFTDQPAYKAKDGRFLFAGLKGFLAVNPVAFNWKDTMPVVYVTSFKVLNKEWKNAVNLEEIHSIRLGAGENFFSFEMIGLQYEDPADVWYGYKLEGFDKDWIYTRERIVNYTNVPGANYTFRFKVTNDPGNWNVAEKTISIHIATVFYKTWWFRALSVALLIGIVFFVYRYRNRQKEKLLRLQSKAQLLEKEKALVMFGNLKQQLNPHFLFNSLTSLSGLIETDQQQAGDFLAQMSRIYRYILKNSDREFVSLKQEIDFVQVYVKLQQTRFKQGLQVNVTVADNYLARKIAPVTLQNLVENAIKHNIVDEETPLQIDIYTEEEYVVVRNNLQKKSVVETSNKQGLPKLQSLYQYLSAKPVLIREDKTHFTISIPLL